MTPEESQAQTVEAARFALAHPEMLVSPERWREFVRVLLAWIDDTPRIPIKDL